MSLTGQESRMCVGIRERVNKNEMVVHANIEDSIKYIVLVQKNKYSRLNGFDLWIRDKVFIEY